MIALAAAVVTAADGAARVESLTVLAGAALLAAAFTIPAIRRERHLRRRDAQDLALRHLEEERAGRDALRRAVEAAGRNGEATRG